ncbi:amidohydrolase 2 [Gloeopeniophorella convolvens]|nr:amidohydrolase 2 [Gloeopeniophorella convolvens]
MEPPQFEELVTVLQRYPAIDNHAHPLLTEDNRDHLPFDGLTSEGDGATLDDAVHTVAHHIAKRDLAQLYGLPYTASWEDVKNSRSARPYVDLCDLCFNNAKIACILIDDGLGGVSDFAEGYEWHNKFTYGPTRRIVRVEIVAQDILAEMFQPDIPGFGPGLDLLTKFSTLLRARLKVSAEDPVVVGFKSIVCYRTGLNVDTASDTTAEVEALGAIYDRFRIGTTTPLRLADKPINDLVVRTALEIASEYNKPVQFHTGLGDPDITLALASPAHLQPLIAAYSKTTFVLLHASYPFMREAGYLASAYKNVYVDIGEVFPIVSWRGQVALIQQIFELTPLNKVLWSSDGHWWPETYYLGSFQARRALTQVLVEAVKNNELTEATAVAAAKNILFHTANRLYHLGLGVNYDVD